MKYCTSATREDMESVLRYSVHHIRRIEQHYTHAIKKHPYFCDKITHLSGSSADAHLDLQRESLSIEEHIGDVEAVDIIQCELLEAVQAYTHKDAAHAVEELYDCIAVLLRTIDVLEGRQKLGKPETNS